MFYIAENHAGSVRSKTETIGFFVVYLCKCLRHDEHSFVHLSNHTEFCNDNIIIILR